jgi:UDP-N-acetyl-D-glucosamine dehydrogenase
MPHFVIEKIIRGLNKQKKSINGSKILILGVSYKKDIDDIRESPSLDVMRLLLQKEGRLLYNDPYVSEVSLDNMVLKSQELTASLLKSVDCVVITTDHSNYDYEMIVKNSALIVDTRNVTGGIEGESDNIIKL